VDHWGLWTNGGCGPMGAVDHWGLWTTGGCGPMGAVDQWGLLHHGKKNGVSTLILYP